MCERRRKTRVESSTESSCFGHTHPAGQHYKTAYIVVHVPEDNASKFAKKYG